MLRKQGVLVVMKKPLEANREELEEEEAWLHSNFKLSNQDI